MSLLKSFAVHTGHIAAESADVSAMARKWIVAHVAADVSTTYRLIADDLDAVVLRTQDPPFSAYAHKQMDPATFVWVMRDGYPHGPVDTRDPQTPLLGAFCDALFPENPKEERWQRLQRDDLWKPRAYFVAAQCRESPELVRAITGDDARFPDLWSRIRLYQQEVGGRASPLEWAAILEPLTHLRAYPADAIIPRIDEAAAAEEESLTPDVVPVTSNVALWKDIQWKPHEAAEKQLDWKSIRVHPVMKEYREQTLIAPNAPTHKVFKQVLLRGMGITEVPPEIRVHAQDFIRDSPTPQEKERIASLISEHLQGNALTTTAICTDEEAHQSAYQVMAATSAATQVTPTQFLRDSILYYTAVPPDANAATTHAYKAHLARFPAPHCALSGAVLSIQGEE